MKQPNELQSSERQELSDDAGSFPENRNPYDNRMISGYPAKVNQTS
jgi:hypothetical protein